MTAPVRDAVPTRVVRAPARLGHVAALDGLRGLAVGLVVLDHARVPPFDAAPGAGAAGVTTFFVLSGFLITSLLIAERDRTGTVAIGAFFVRRAVRLLPALWACLGISGLLLVRLGRAPWSGVAAAGEAALFYYANFASVRHLLGYFDPMWSLAVEEHFYLVWPFLFLVLARRVPRRALWPCLATLTLVGVLWRLHLGATEPAPVALRTANRRTDGAAWALLLGATLAAARAVRPRLTGRVPPAATAVVAAVGFVGVPAVHAAAGHPLTVVGGPVLSGGVAALLVVAAVGGDGRGGGWMAAAPLRWLGRRSYAVYLWQYPLVWLLPAAPFGLTGTWRLLLVSAVTLGVAEVSWWLVENPANLLRRRLVRA